MSNQKDQYSAEDILSFHLLEKYLPKDSYIPYSSSSFSFRSIQIIVNDIILNKRNRIIEFGSGISTMIFSQVLKDLDLPNSCLISLDENLEWASFVKQQIGETTDKFQASVFHCELDEKTGWYKAPTSVSAVQYNLVMVDGPSAWQKGRENSRRNALKYLLDNKLVAEKYSIFIDDCNRAGELELLNEWSKTLDKKGRLLTKTLGYISDTSGFNIV